MNAIRPSAPGGPWSPRAARRERLCRCARATAAPRGRGGPRVLIDMPGPVGALRSNAPRRVRVRADRRAVRHPAPARGGGLTSALLPRALPAHRADPDTPTFYEDWLTTDFGYHVRRAPALRRGSATTSAASRSADPCPTQERAGQRRAQRREPRHGAGTEFSATDGSSAGRRRRRRRGRRRLAVLAVQDLRRPDDVAAARGRRRRVTPAGAETARRAGAASHGHRRAPIARPTGARCATARGAYRRRAAALIRAVACAPAAWRAAPG